MVDLKELIKVVQEYNDKVTALLEKNNALYEKDLRNLEISELFKLVEEGKLLSEPYVKRINLSTAKTNDFYSLAGNYFYIVDAYNSSNWIKVKFNRLENDLIKFEKGFGVRKPFTKFWVTFDAQASGWVDVLIGQISPQLLEIIDNRTGLITQQTLEEIRDTFKSTTASDNSETTVGNVSEVQLLNAVSGRKSFTVQASDTNTGKIYILYKTGVGSTKYKAILQAGQLYADDKWRGVVYAIASALNQKCCAQEET